LTRATRVVQVKDRMAPPAGRAAFLRAALRIEAGSTPPAAAGSAPASEVAIRAAIHPGSPTNLPQRAGSVLRDRPATEA
jgi:hypothetical protein